MRPERARRLGLAVDARTQSGSSARSSGWTGGDCQRLGSVGDIRYLSRAHLTQDARIGQPVDPASRLTRLAVASDPRWSFPRGR